MKLIGLIFGIATLITLTLNFDTGLSENGFMGSNEKAGVKYIVDSVKDGISSRAKQHLDLDIKFDKESSFFYDGQKQSNFIKLDVEKTKFSETDGTHASEYKTVIERFSNTFLWMAILIIPVLLIKFLPFKFAFVGLVILGVGYLFINFVSTIIVIKAISLIALIFLFIKVFNHKPKRAVA